MTATIHHGNCLDVLRGMPDNSVDAVVCDPPYGLSNTSPDKVTDTIVRWVQGDREYAPTGKGFMGASWDAFVPPVAVWDECLRVLKPGGHLVAFAGSRTQDLMGLAIRLAGFDIRENLAWLYGSGFPKSLDVSKAIDKAAGAEREVVGHKGGRYAYGFSETTGAPMGSISPRENAAANKARSGQITAPASPEAVRWQGWGTALKPGHEPIILARKPFPGAVAANTLTWGTGGLNIDATRIGTTDTVTNHSRGSTSAKSKGIYGDSTAQGEHQTPGQALGRWPSNVVLDPDTAQVLDQQSGTLQATGRTVKRELSKKAGAFDGIFSGSYKPGDEIGYSDSGGASRYFYVAREDNECQAAPAPASSTGTWPYGSEQTLNAPNTVEPDTPFMYAAKAPKKERPSYEDADGRIVQHSTVKPLSICSWLVKLVTPPGGTVLDPFAGSGTTVEAAILEGFNVIGIEREAEYLPLIQQRIDRANDVLPMAS